MARRKTRRGRSSRTDQSWKCPVDGTEMEKRKAAASPSSSTTKTTCRTQWRTGTHACPPLPSLPRHALGRILTHHSKYVGNRPLLEVRVVFSKAGFVTAAQIEVQTRNVD